MPWRCTVPGSNRGPILSVDQTTLSPIRPRQRYEQVADRLAADIRAGRLAPGERLPSERDLARRLEVGRASVREAIAALQVAGMIETRPGSGSFVAAGAAERTREAHDSSPSDLLEARALLEPAVARLAAQRGRADADAEALLAAMEQAADAGDRAGWNDCDRRFHQRIAALTGNPVLLDLADRIAAVMDEPLWQRLRDDSIAVPGRTTLHLAEHRMIYEAIAEGDADAAELYAAQHIRPRSQVHDPRLKGPNALPRHHPRRHHPVRRVRRDRRAALEGNVAALLDAGVHGVVATGTMGEAGSLSTAERRTVVGAVARAVDGRVPGDRRRVGGHARGGDRARRRRGRAREPAR